MELDDGEFEEGVVQMLLALRMTLVPTHPADVGAELVHLTPVGELAAAQGAVLYALVIAGMQVDGARTPVFIEYEATPASPEQPAPVTSVLANMGLDFTVQGVSGDALEEWALAALRVHHGFYSERSDEVVLPVMPNTANIDVFTATPRGFIVDLTRVIGARVQSNPAVGRYLFGLAASRLVFEAHPFAPGVAVAIRPDEPAAQRPIAPRGFLRPLEVVPVFGANPLSAAPAETHSAVASTALVPASLELLVRDATGVMRPLTRDERALVTVRAENSLDRAFVSVGGAGTSPLFRVARRIVGALARSAQAGRRAMEAVRGEYTEAWRLLADSIVRGEEPVPETAVEELVLETAYNVVRERGIPAWVSLADGGVVMGGLAEVERVFFGNSTSSAEWHTALDVLLAGDGATEERVTLLIMGHDEAAPVSFRVFEALAAGVTSGMFAAMFSARGRGSKRPAAGRALDEFRVLCTKYTEDNRGEVSISSGLVERLEALASAVVTYHARTAHPFMFADGEALVELGQQEEALLSPPVVETSGAIVGTGALTAIGDTFAGGPNRVTFEEAIGAQNRKVAAQIGMWWSDGTVVPFTVESVYRLKPVGVDRVTGIHLGEFGATQFSRGVPDVREIDFDYAGGVVGRPWAQARVLAAIARSGPPDVNSTPPLVLQVEGVAAATFKQMGILGEAVAWLALSAGLTPNRDSEIVCRTPTERAIGAAILQLRMNTPDFFKVWALPPNNNFAGDALVRAAAHDLERPNVPGSLIEFLTPSAPARADNADRLLNELGAAMRDGREPDVRDLPEDLVHAVTVNSEQAAHHAALREELATSATPISWWMRPTAMSRAFKLGGDAAAMGTAAATKLALQQDMSPEERARAQIAALVDMFAPETRIGAIVRSL